MRAAVFGARIDNAMIFRDKNDFKKILPEYTRLLGLDVGEKTIGLALSDAMHTIATPLKTIKRKKFSVDIIPIIEIIEKENITGLVVGYPINMDGSEGRKCQSMMQFSKNFLQHKDIPIMLWDERLSTVAAQRPLDEAGMNTRKSKEVIDKMAAAFILQGVLDSFQA